MKTGSFSLIKELNTSVILNTIRSNNSISRAEIASMTGLTPATVTNLTSRLLEHKLIKETELGESSGGRKPVMLEINGSEYNVACINIGSKAVTVSIFDINGNLITSANPEVIKNDYKASLNSITAKLSELSELSMKRILGVGVSCEGMINEDEGICVFSSNLGWENIDIREEIYSKTGLPVFVDNDVHVIALGEKWFGAAKNTDDFVLFYTGFGLGLAVMNKDGLYRGSMNYAGEMGHTVLDPDGPICTCGNHGCVQAFASASALMRDLKSIGYIDEKEPPLEEIISASLGGDEILGKLFHKQAHYIGIAAANSINLFNPSVLIFNGYISQLGDDIKAIITQQIFRNCLKNAKSNIKIVYSELNSDALPKGAAALVISKLFEYPSIFFGDKYETLS